MFTVQVCSCMMFSKLCLFWIYVYCTSVFMHDVFQALSLSQLPVSIGGRAVAASGSLTSYIGNEESGDNYHDKLG